VRSALEAVSVVEIFNNEILAIKMLRFAVCARAGNYTNTKVQKLVEKGFDAVAVSSALEAVNGDEWKAMKMLRFAERARARNLIPCMPCFTLAYFRATFSMRWSEVKSP